MGVGAVVPNVAVTGGDFFYASGVVVEGQVEGVDIGAAGARLGVVVSVDTRRGVFGAMPG